MSEKMRGGEKSDAGQPPAPDAPAPATEATSTGISSLSFVSKPKEPLTPTTPTTADAATTGTDSDHSSEHGKDEGRDEGDWSDQPRQVIAVSVSKGPSAFFNLARKFLVTDEVVDLSALEGAIVSAVDAAHLLERAKIATIVRIQTSYVAVEPKTRKGPHPTSSVSEEASGSPPGTTSATSATTGTPSRQQPQAMYSSSPVAAAAAASSAVADSGPSSIDQHGAYTVDSSTSSPPGKHKSSAGPMRRARIVITVKRTEAYKKWLVENPVPDTHAGHDDDHI